MALEYLKTDGDQFWCRIPSSLPEADEQALEKMQEVVRKKFPKMTLELPDPPPCIVVGAEQWTLPDDRPNVMPPTGLAGIPGQELNIVDQFDEGFAEQFREAKRVDGMVRKLWYVATVTAKPNTDEQQSFLLGVGIAADLQVAKARALYSSSLRIPALTEAVFSKSAVRRLANSSVKKEEGNASKG